MENKECRESKEIERRQCELDDNALELAAGGYEPEDYSIEERIEERKRRQAEAWEKAIAWEMNKENKK